MDAYLSQKEYDAELLKDASFKTEKAILSNDAYAICEFIEQLKNELRRLK